MSSNDNTGEAVPNKESMFNELDRIALNPEIEDSERKKQLLNQVQVFIKTVMRSTQLSDDEKTALVQELSTYQYQRELKKTKSGRIILSNCEYPPFLDENITYVDEENTILGCYHYNRGCSMLCPQCNQWFTCRLCHDEVVPDHYMDRYHVKYIACMKCKTVQFCSNQCVSCHAVFSEYYCDICHLWKDNEEPSFHCPDCNICRVGKGIGIDTFHCHTCNNCYNLDYKDDHKCYEGYLHGPCPVCFEELSTSRSSPQVLPCNHFIHTDCLDAMLERGEIGCPLCKKSMMDFTSYFKLLDKVVASQPMPEEYRDLKQVILCNDCGQKNVVPFHFIYHKCPNPDCMSYNTQVIKNSEYNDVD